MKLAIMQPYFFPYIGYFQLICAADRFILLDEVQYIRHGWINRNRMLKPADCHQYIVAPLKKHAQKATIKEVAVVDGNDWKRKIIRQIEHYKKKAPFYSVVKTLLEDCFSVDETNIAQLNALYLKRVFKYFDLNPSLTLASSLQLDYSTVSDSGEWALRICEQLNATGYINPVGGASLFDKEKFEKSNITLSFLQPVLQPYNQHRPSFEEGLSILDVMMFNPVEKIHDMIKQHRIL